MPNEIKKILSIDTSKAQKDVNQLDNRIKQLDNTLQSVGNSADLANNNINKFERTQKQLEIITQLSSGLASGFAAVTGALALTSKEGGKFEGVIQNLISAITIAQGIGGLSALVQGLRGAATTFKTTTTSIKTFIMGLRGIKLAIAATGLGVLVVLLGEVISYFMQANDAEDEFIEKQKELDKLRQEAKEKLDLQNKEIFRNASNAYKEQVLLAKEEYAILLKQAKTKEDLVKAQEKLNYEINKSKKAELEIQVKTLENEKARNEAIVRRLTIEKGRTRGGDIGSRKEEELSKAQTMIDEIIPKLTEFKDELQTLNNTILENTRATEINTNEEKKNRANKSSENNLSEYKFKSIDALEQVIKRLELQKVDSDNTFHKLTKEFLNATKGRYDSNDPSGKYDPSSYLSRQQFGSDVHSKKIEYGDLLNTYSKSGVVLTEDLQGVYSKLTVALESSLNLGVVIAKFKKDLEEKKLDERIEMLITKFSETTNESDREKIKAELDKINTDKINKDVNLYYNEIYEKNADVVGTTLSNIDRTTSETEFKSIMGDLKRQEQLLDNKAKTKTNGNALLNEPYVGFESLQEVQSLNESLSTLESIREQTQLINDEYVRNSETINGNIQALVNAGRKDSDEYKALVDEKIRLDTDYKIKRQTLINQEKTYQLKAYEDEKKAYKAKEQFVLNYAKSALKSAASAFAEHTVAYKATASAQGLIDTYESAIGSYKALAGIPIVGPALGAAAAGAATYAGIQNIKRIWAVDAEGGATATAENSYPNIQAPNVNLDKLPFGQFQNVIGDAEQDEINKGNRVYVVESDINEVGRRVEVRENNATF